MMDKIFMPVVITGVIFLVVALLSLIVAATLAIWTESHLYRELGYTGFMFAVLGLFSLMLITFPGNDWPYDSWKRHRKDKK